MTLIPTSPCRPRGAAVYHAQPDSRAGTIYDRAERRRPHERRRQPRPLACSVDRRRQRRRPIGDRGHRWPDPPPELRLQP